MTGWEIALAAVFVVAGVAVIWVTRNRRRP
jgi:hypothetical protein